MLPPIETVPAKTIVTRTKSSEWFGTDYNMNLYRGCCHGCIYLSLIHISEPTRH